MTITSYYDPYVSNNYLNNIQSGKVIPYITILYNKSCAEDVDLILSRYLQSNNQYLKSGVIYPVMNDYVYGMPIIVFFGQVYHQIKAFDEIADLIGMFDYTKKIKTTQYHKEYTAPIRENLAAGQFRIPEQVASQWGF